jgi:hypothetical protein
MKMPDVVDNDPFDPKKIADALFKRCREVKKYRIRCIVDEAWTGFKGPVPFDVEIKDGVFTIGVVAFTQREAMLKIVDTLPVLKFLDEDNGE